MAEPNVLTGARALAVLADVGLPSIAAGVIARRRRVVGLLERTQADRRTVTRIGELRRRFGAGPVELAIPGRRIVVVIDPADVQRVLEDTPSPFHPADRLKEQALRKFQPHAVLISHGPVRDQRRQFNEEILDTAAPLHHLADSFARVIAEEAAEMVTGALRTGSLSSAEFTTAWWKLVRRLVLGDAARDDERITDDLWRLRRAANWSFAGRPHHRLRERFERQLYQHAYRAEPTSLIGALSAARAKGDIDPVGQLPHWLFAFDAAGMATARALAVLSTHPDKRSHCETTDLDAVALRPYLRSCLLESVRLWPTTPAVLRETTTDVPWRDGYTVRRGATVLIPVPAFHRDPDLLPFADEFAPEIWLDGRAQHYPQLVPFSAGPAECPGRNLVLFVTSTLMAHLLASTHMRLDSEPSLPPGAPMPATFNQFGLRFHVTPAVRQPA